MAISIAPASGRSCRSWSSKQYVLAALAGTLAAIAVVSVVSVLLCPAHIYFYLADASVGPRDDQPAKYFNFTLVANNTSRLTEVHYGAMQIEVWVGKTSWVSAVVDTSTWPWQKSRNTSRYPVGGDIEVDEKLNLDSQKNSSGGGGGDEEEDDRYPEVVIKAQVRFRYGHARSRLYNIIVSCPSVDFNDEDGTNSSTSLPVDCTA